MQSFKEYLTEISIGDPYVSLDDPEFFEKYSVKRKTEFSDIMLMVYFITNRKTRKSMEFDFVFIHETSGNMAVDISFDKKDTFQFGAMKPVFESPFEVMRVLGACLKDALTRVPGLLKKALGPEYEKVKLIVKRFVFEPAVDGGEEYLKVKDLKRSKFYNLYRDTMGKYLGIRISNVSIDNVEGQITWNIAKPYIVLSK